jgi:hypothetical protein
MTGLVGDWILDSGYLILELERRRIWRMAKCLPKGNLGCPDCGVPAWISDAGSWGNGLNSPIEKKFILPYIDEVAAQNRLGVSG